LVRMALVQRRIGETRTPYADIGAGNNFEVSEDSFRRMPGARGASHLHQLYRVKERHDRICECLVNMPSSGLHGNIFRMHASTVEADHHQIRMKYRCMGDDRWQSMGEFPSGFSLPRDPSQPHGTCNAKGSSVPHYKYKTSIWMLDGLPNLRLKILWDVKHMLV
jgi:hypothetical protein